MPFEIIEETTMWNDPIIDEIYKARDQHAAKFDYDVRRIFDDLNFLVGGG
jgi:hypothetical protein